LAKPAETAAVLAFRSSAFGVSLSGLVFRPPDGSIALEPTWLAKDPLVRLHSMNRLLAASLFVSLAAVSASVSISAQVSVPPNQVTHFTDTSMLKPPAGAKIAVLEWEDLECPACAHAFPIVHAALKDYAAKGVYIPLVRRDFQIPGHIWSHEASIYARYLQDKVSPDLATDYRRLIFSSQFRIASKDDLNRITNEFFQSHGKQLPFVIDPTGQLEKEVTADKDLGLKLGLQETPTLIVVTPQGWIQVKDVMQLDTAIDMARAQVAANATPTPAHRTVAKK
jgi:protein-disulfide isomerase